MSIVQESYATGEEINEIISNIEPALYDVNRGHAIIALLSLSLILMNPMVSEEDLHRGVKETSQFMCLFLEGIEPHAPGEEKLLN